MRSKNSLNRNFKSGLVFNVMFRQYTYVHENTEIHGRTKCSPLLQIWLPQLSHFPPQSPQLVCSTCTSHHRWHSAWNGNNEIFKKTKQKNTLTWTISSATLHSCVLFSCYFPCYCVNFPLSYKQSRVQPMDTSTPPLTSLLRKHQIVTSCVNLQLWYQCLKQSFLSFIEADSYQNGNEKYNLKMKKHYWKGLLISKIWLH